MLEDADRGHRLDGMIARLKYLAPQAQFLYLSATIGLPKVLAKKLDCTLVRYDSRPVALEPVKATTSWEPRWSSRSPGPPARKEKAPSGSTRSSTRIRSMRQATSAVREA
jgi:Lhr-like helicase